MSQRVPAYVGLLICQVGGRIAQITHVDGWKIRFVYVGRRTEFAWNLNAIPFKAWIAVKSGLLLNDTQAK